VLISVEDSGTGIDSKNIGRIFEAFFTTKSHGMGMGLSICRSIIEAHGGNCQRHSLIRTDRSLGSSADLRRCAMTAGLATTSLPAVPAVPLKMRPWP
jgi:hypothetical protein